MAQLYQLGGNDPRGVVSHLKAPSKYPLLNVAAADGIKSIVPSGCINVESRAKSPVL